MSEHRQNSDRSYDGFRCSEHASKNWWQNLQTEGRPFRVKVDGAIQRINHYQLDKYHQSNWGIQLIVIHGAKSLHDFMSPCNWVQWWKINWEYDKPQKQDHKQISLGKHLAYIALDTEIKDRRFDEMCPISLKSFSKHDDDGDKNLKKLHT